MLRVLSVPEARCRPSTMNLRMLLSTKTLSCSPGDGGPKRERAESTMAYGSASSDHSTYLIDLSGLGMGSILARVASNYEGKVRSVLNVLAWIGERLLHLWGQNCDLCRRGNQVCR